MQVYCDMEGANCGGEGGWTRVAFINMTKPGATCPQGLEQTMFNMELCTVVGSQVDQVVCLLLLIILSAIPTGVWKSAWISAKCSRCI